MQFGHCYVRKYQRLPWNAMGSRARQDVVSFSSAISAAEKSRGRWQVWRTNLGRELEQWKKPWLVVWYRGWHFLPNYIRGLFHKPWHFRIPFLNNQDDSWKVSGTQVFVRGSRLSNLTNLPTESVFGTFFFQKKSTQKGVTGKAGDMMVIWISWLPLGWKTTYWNQLT